MSGTKSGQRILDYAFLEGKSCPKCGEAMHVAVNYERAAPDTGFYVTYVSGEPFCTECDGCPDESGFWGTNNLFEDFMLRLIPEFNFLDCTDYPEEYSSENVKLEEKIGDMISDLIDRRTNRAAKDILKRISEYIKKDTKL